MAHGRNVLQAIQIMKNTLIKGDNELLSELYEFGESSGRLTKPQILQIWNGTPLERFGDKELRALFEFLNYKYRIGSSDYYFGKRQTHTQVNAPIEFDRKNRYLETIKDQKKREVETSVLSRVGSKIEAVFAKDVCELSKDELIAGFSNMGYTNARVASTELSVVKHYITWCSENGYYAPALNEIKMVKSDDIGFKRMLLHSFVPTPEKLRDIIYATKDKNGPNTDSIIICLYWLGLTLDEVYDLEKSDVDINNGIVNNDHYGQIKIPIELIEIFRSYVNNDEVYKNDERLVLISDETKYFLKRFIYPGTKKTGERLSRVRIKMLVTNFKKQYIEENKEEINFSVKNLNTSGICWRLYQKEKNGESITDEIYRFEGRISNDLGLRVLKTKYQSFKELFCGA